MIDTATVTRLVQDGYEARRSGDKDALRQYFAPGATFRMVGHSELAGRLPVHATEALPVIDALMDQFTFHEIEIVHLVTDGKSVSIHMRVDASASGQRYQTELCDIWDLDEDGRITAITEFLDTELVARMAADAMA